MSVTIELSSVIARSEDLVEAEIDGETVMMSVENGEYYGLDSVASYIWKLIAAPKEVSQICDEVIVQYDVAVETCQEDILKFVHDMAELNVVTVQ